VSSASGQKRPNVANDFESANLRERSFAASHRLMLRANCRHSDGPLWQSARHMLKKRWPRSQLPGPLNHRPGTVGVLFKRVVISALSECTEPLTKPRAGRLHRFSHLGLLRDMQRPKALLCIQRKAAARSDRRHTCSLFGYGFAALGQGRPNYNVGVMSAIPPIAAPISQTVI
jgi:hypothetical protein